MSDLQPQDTSPPPRRRGLKIALAVSLALNLAIVGLAAGFALNYGGPKEGGPPRLAAMGLGPFALALSREDREALRDRVASDGGEILHAERREIGHALRDVEQALLANPFERDAVEAALARSRRAAEAMQASGHGALLDYVEEMSPAERAELAENLRRMLRRFGGARR
ncbi:periplasmic heavy metal sensor [Gymnodinialimonas sp. 2305UL16-5]|uniref:periplasmic heavy metal sensor n=1 Tax=Gymnodinialimonas mytili TaxID=3126503 RepID=UPI0030A472FB